MAIGEVEVKIMAVAICHTVAIKKTATADLAEVETISLMMVVRMS